MKKSKSDGPAIPIVKKFTNKRVPNSRVLVVALPNDQGYKVVSTSFSRATPVILAECRVSDSSVLPVPMQKEAEFVVAVKLGRWLAKSGQPPSAKKVRGWRRRALKKYLAVYQMHTATKIALKQTEPVAVRKATVQKMLDSVNAKRIKHRSFIMIYDPKRILRRRQKQRAHFTVHTAACGRLDHDRSRAVRRGGDSWVSEGPDVHTVVGDTLAELTTDKKGYVLSDFFIHSCPKLG